MLYLIVATMTYVITIFGRRVLTDSSPDPEEHPYGPEDPWALPQC